MFPLGSVLFPGQLLPLHIFEPRYCEMLEHCLAGDREFGVVLIERGHEVGGGDIRSDVGTVATILDVAQPVPGHWTVVAAGTRRVRVQRWHRDDPWPRADVVDLVDSAGTGSGAESLGEPGVPDLWTDLQQRFRLVAALATELGADAYRSAPEVSDDPGVGSFHIAALSPLGDFDRQKVLATTGVRVRLTMLSDMLDEQAETLRAALAAGDDPPPFD